MLTYFYQENGNSPAVEDEVGFTSPDPVVAPGRLGSDPVIGLNPVGVGIESASLIVGTKIDGTLGSSKGPITGRSWIGSTPKGGGGASGAGGAGEAKGRTILAIGDFENPLPREGS